MQVFFAAPPVVASPDSPIAADLPLSEAAPADGSFASLLDSNSTPSAAPAASKPAAASSQAPESPEDAEVAESVADDQGEAAKADEETVIDAWLATAVEAAIPLPIPPIVVSQQPPSTGETAALPDSSGESTPAVNTDVLLAGSVWPEIDAAPLSVGGSDTEKSVPSAVQPKIAAGRGAAHRRESTGAGADTQVADVAVSNTSASADEAQAPMTAEVSPAVSPENRSLRREERPIVGGGAVPAQEADILGGTASGLQMQESVAVTWAARGSGKVTDVESEGGAVAWADPAHPVTTDARAAGDSLDRQALEGDGGAKSAYLGPRVPIQIANSSSEMAAPSMSDDGGQTAPATSPVVAAPTLAQVLVEGSQSRVPRSGSAKVTALTASSEANVSAAVASDASSQETEPDAVGISAESTGAAEAEKTVAPASRMPRENLAVTSGKSLKVAAKDAMVPLRRNFQNVEQKGVGDAGGFVGTGTAKDAEAMVAHTQVLPTTASSALDAGEAVPAEPSTGNTAAADAVRETLEEAERARQTGRNNVELRLQTSGDESLRVHLRLQDGVVHAKFVTQSTELQQALSREWDLLAPRLAEKGIKFGETSFENRDQSGQSTAQNAFTSGQQRHHTHDQGQAYQQAEERAFTLASLTATTTAASRRSPVTASASVAAPASLNTAEARGLRVWA